MNIQQQRLPAARSWDAMHQPAHYIAQAQFAVMREGRVELVMGPHEYMTGMATMHICYAGHEGLHYDADSSISPQYMSELLESKEADITNDWDTCEVYLKNYSLQQGLRD